MEKIASKESFINKDLSLELKGIAIIMMIFGHCMGHPEYWTSPYASAVVIGVAPFLRMLSRMSVGIFTLLAGYSCYKNGLAEKSLKVRVSALKKLFIHYWFQTFIVFLPVALVFGEYKVTLNGMFYNLTGLKDALILFAWYVPFFATTILLIVPLMKLLLRGKTVQDVVIAVTAGSLLRGILYLIRGYSDYLYILCDWSGYYTVYMIGYLAAKHALFERLLSFSVKNAPCISSSTLFRSIISVVALIIVLVLRYYVQGIRILSFESLYVFAFIYCLVRLIGGIREGSAERKGRPVLIKLGKLSTDIWFFHAIFFSTWTKEACQKIVYWIPGGVLKTVIILLISSGFAFILNSIINYSFAERIIKTGVHKK